MTHAADRLSNTVALITGASSGIGEATAKLLAQRGVAVALVARRRDRLEALATEITEAGGRAHVIVADVMDRKAAYGAVEETVRQLGRLDIVVNNAGVMLLGPMLEAEVDEWDNMIDLNLKGVLYVAKAAFPHLLAAAKDHERGVADLVNISSVAGRLANANSAVYNMTKFGVRAMSEALRQEVTDQHLRVSVVEPGAVATELMDHIDERFQQAARDRFKGVEKLESEDIAETIEFIVTRRRRVAVNEVLIRPTEQVR